MDAPKINKEEILNYYKDHSLEKTIDYFNIDYYHIVKLFKEWGVEIKKGRFSQPLNKEEVIEYYKDHNLSDTAKKFKKDSSDLKNILLSWGVHIKTRSELRTIPINKEEAIEYYKDHTLKEVCSKFHKSNGTMTKLFKEWGVEIRSLKEASKISLENQYKEKGGKEKVWEERNLKKQQTNIEKYGAPSIFQAEGYKEKKAKTCLEKYGNEIYQQTQEFKEKFKSTCLERYGVESPMQNLEVIEKAKLTSLEKYGVEYYNQTQEFKDKRVVSFIEKYGDNYYDVWVAKTKNTNLEKYGVESYSQTQEFKDRKKEIQPQINDKTKSTCLERYGVDSYLKTQEFKNRSKNTSLERYGVEHYSQTEEYKTKSSQTCLERYGVENYSQTQEYLERRKQTCLERYGEDSYSKTQEFHYKLKSRLKSKYGVDHALQSPKLLKKKLKTCKERYGVNHYGQTQECKDRIKNTCLERYGVEYSCFLPQAQNFKNKESQPNQEFLKLLEKYSLLNIDREFPLSHYKYDFKLNNTLVEINPFATHNSTWGVFGNPPLDKNYHLNKSKTAQENNYRCIHIFDWDDEEKIVKSLKPKKVLYARKCLVKEVDKNTTNKFLNEYHFQNKCNNQTVRLGLYYNNELISIMTFGKPRYNKKYGWELLRLCTKFEYVVVGGSQKLFKYFISKYSPNSIISYCDLSKFNGDIYKQLGFKFQSSTPPTKHWYNPKTKRHITNNLLLQRGFDQLLGDEYGYFGKGTSNEELMLEHDFVEIYDCGQKVYGWYNLT